MKANREWLPNVEGCLLVVGRFVELKHVERSLLTDVCTVSSAPVAHRGREMCGANVGR
jgi:hypothetical protein